MPGEDGPLSDAQLADLAALADGSLAPPRRDDVAAAVERSPQLRALVAEQRAALAAVGALDAPAPAGVRGRVEAERARSQPRARRRGVALAGGLAAAAAAAALLAVVVLPGSEPGGPTVGEAAALAGRAVSAPAPVPVRGKPNLLAASVAGVPFPDYEAKLGWRASGARADELDGRETRTVFYDRNGRRVAYTIVAGAGLKWPLAARRTVRGGVELRFLDAGGKTIVTWLRSGHTCVLSGAGVPRDGLLELAAWNGDGTVSF